MTGGDGGSATPALGFTTRAIHRAEAPPVRQTPSSVPLYQTSTWRFETLEDFAETIAFRRAGHVYGRGYGNPTVEAFEAAIADLEGTETAAGFVSGMAAVHTTITALARAGQRIVSSRALYGGTHSLFDRVLPRYGVEVTFVDPLDLEAVADALPGAALFYTETISNPLVAVADLPALAALCRERGVPSVVDNTFASPYLCNPAVSGFDYVVHSATKYLGGHSDLIGGVVCMAERAREEMRTVLLDVGGAMQPLEAWLCQRSLATLALRMERHCSNAGVVAAALAASPAVARVHYPGLPDHPTHEAANRLLRRPGAMLAVELHGGLEAARTWCESLEVAWIAGSLGGSHTLVTHPASTTHRQVDPEARRAQGLTDGLVRVSVGLEDPEDLVADLCGALPG